MIQSAKKISFKSKALIAGLLDYLDEKGDESLLSEVSKSLEREAGKKLGQDEIIVTSVVGMSPAQMNKIKLCLDKMLNKKLPAVNKIDQNLIGGFTIRVNDWFFDSSISHQIELLRQSLLI